MYYPLCEMVHMKDSLLLIKKVENEMVVVGFLSCYMNGPLPHVEHHITINKMC